MTRDVGAVILVLVGGAILRISAGDAYLRYVKESLRPWLLVSGSVLVLLGLLSLVDVWRAGRAPVDDAEETPSGDDGTVEHADPDGHVDHAAPRAAWLLLLPVLALFLVAPPALGAYTAERETAVVAAPATDSEFPPLPSGDPVPVSLSEYAARAVWDDGRSLDGRTVALTGFVSAAPGGQWYLTRLGLTCCAADAYATKVTVLGAPYDPPADTWVTLTGQWVAGGGVRSETAIPNFKVTALAEVPVPENPYE